MILIILLTVLFVHSVNTNSIQVIADKIYADEVNKSQKLYTIMYHIILEDESKINDYIITPTQLEEDLIYLKENGYTTITTEQLLDFVNNGTPLPDKPIMITFDDGYETVFRYAMPLLEKYNMTAITNVLGKQVDYYSENYSESNINYAHSTWEQLAIMQNSNIFEIGNHTYNMHLEEGSSRFGTLINYSESLSHYTIALTTDIEKLNTKFAEYLGFTPNVFAYPYGKISPESKPIIEDMGFKIILTCEEKVNIIDYGENTPIYIGRYNRSGLYSSSDFFAKFV